MIRYALMMVFALAPTLVASSAQAGSKLGLGTDGHSGNGVQLNGFPAGGFAVETVELPGGRVAGFSSGVGGGSDVS